MPRLLRLLGVEAPPAMKHAMLFCRPVLHVEQARVPPTVTSRDFQPAVKVMSSAVPPGPKTAELDDASMTESRVTDSEYWKI